MAQSTNPQLPYLDHAPRGQALHPASPPAAAAHLRGNKQRSDTSTAIPALLSDSSSTKDLPSPSSRGSSLFSWYWSPRPPEIKQLSERLLEQPQAQQTIWAESYVRSHG